MHLKLDNYCCKASIRPIYKKLLKVSSSCTVIFAITSIFRLMYDFRLILANFGKLLRNSKNYLKVRGGLRFLLTPNVD